jgi:hypothetical protein
LVLVLAGGEGEPRKDEGTGIKKGMSKDRCCGRRRLKKKGKGGVA